ncbi:hypothetical protein J2X98_002219 [Pseudarthrobacter enclensis]|uniref:Uncharacterized protein n=1 Tax=Pseudarthrobacter enclensis TaxID=993070 RepID=A0ABT9RUZ0_9MICC|nr:hypothetical protein [Pseudarthrobacter enclensis]
MPPNMLTQAPRCIPPRHRGAPMPGPRGRCASPLTTRPPRCRSGASRPSGALVPPPGLPEYIGDKPELAQLASTTQGASAGSDAANRNPLTAACLPDPLQAGHQRRRGSAHRRCHRTHLRQKSLDGRYVHGAFGSGSRWVQTTSDIPCRRLLKLTCADECGHSVQTTSENDTSKEIQWPLNFRSKTQCRFLCADSAAG